MHIRRVEVLSDEIVGGGGFLAVRRVWLVNQREDGSRSAPYLCDFVVRPKGVDAVVVGVYTRAGDRVRVLLRDGLRLPLALGRRAEELPVPDAKRYLFFREVVAGIIEDDDRGEAGIRRRAALEVEEEAGHVVDAARVRLLGAGVFPSPGAMAEKFWLAAVEIDDPNAGAPAAGDGSAMEEGAALVWMDLDEAIAACVRGELEDAKTELVLRRLRDELQTFAAPRRSSQP
jgi:ADP-ribose pyrophosphatase